MKFTMGGMLTLNSGAILEVTQNLTVGATYALIRPIPPSISNPTLSGISFENLNGSPVAGNYSFVANSGTLDLVVTSVTRCHCHHLHHRPGEQCTRDGWHQPHNFRDRLAISALGNNLSGTLSNGGGSITTGGFLLLFRSQCHMASSVAYTGTATTNSEAASAARRLEWTVTDGNSLNRAPATATDTVDVVANRVVTPTIAMSTGSTSVGAVHVGTILSGTVTLSSAAADNVATRVTVGNAGPDAFGIAISGGNPSGTFNGSFTDNRVITGTLNTLGTDSNITLTTTGEGLAGESPINVNVGINASIFSGKASWNGNGGNGIWSTGTNRVIPSLLGTAGSLRPFGILEHRRHRDLRRLCR